MIKKVYEKIIATHERATTFIVLISFLSTFIIARLIVYLIDAQVLPDLYLFIGQTHIHHLNYGIFLLSLSGYLALVLPHRARTWHFLAFLFGIGLGLTFDEFALWLFLQNDYYARASYEAIVVIALILLNIVYFSNLWARIFRFIFIRHLKDESDKEER